MPTPIHLQWLAWDAGYLLCGAYIWAWYWDYTNGSRAPMQVLCIFRKVPLCGPTREQCLYAAVHLVGRALVDHCVLNW